MLKRFAVIEKYVISALLSLSSNIALGQTIRTTAQVAPHNIPCRAGVFTGYNVAFSDTPQDELVIIAAISERRKTGDLTLKYCLDPIFDGISSRMQIFINDRVKAANACSDAQLRAIRNSDWHAFLGLVKSQNRILDDINRIVEYEKFIVPVAAKFSNSIKDTGELAMDLSSAGEGFKGLSNLAQLANKGQKAFRHELDEQFDKAEQDNVKDNLIDIHNPWILSGTILTAMADSKFEKDASDIVSFSHSACR